MNTISQILKLDNSVILDVRTREEFMGGHVAGSINIPVSELQDHVEELKSDKHIILCCASGARSAKATRFLKDNGVECTNGGSWLDVNYHTNN
jgi:rhodanese-related sulfurtransferase